MMASQSRLSEEFVLSKLMDKATKSQDENNDDLCNIYLE